MLIIENKAYLTREKVVVDRDEYIETINNMKTIVYKDTKYLERYIGLRMDGRYLKDKTFQRIYRYST